MNTQKIAILFCLFLSACTTRRVPVQLAPQVVQITEGQSIIIRLNEGEIIVVGSESEQLLVEGQTLFPNQTDYKVDSSKDQIQIIANYTGGRPSNVPIRLEVHVPNNVKLKVETEFASITVRDYEGELEVASISGDILVENVDGIVVARSNRGDVKVLHSTGKISVVGNYGLLILESVNGDIGVSTIMGTITFNGLIDTGDTVRLETDHGPVAVNLSPDSALSLQVRSNSGDVTCILPDITSSIRTCNGEVNSSGGTLTIRTVSGAVTMRLIP